MTRLSTLAPGKVNLCLYLGPTREDGYHELLSVVQPVSLFDAVRLEPLAGGAASDRVLCRGIDESGNLATKALERFRAAAGWAGTPVEVTIDKRIPVAAGMGGGSSDAAATLRLASELSGRGADLQALAFSIGADVPVLLDPRLALMEGAGERVTPLAGALAGAIVVAASTEQLSTPAVFAEADRLRLPRSADEIADLRLRVLADPVASGLMVNDLQPAAISLCPSIEPELDRMRSLGAAHAMVTGSGPTVFGLFPDGPPEPGALAPADHVVEPYAA
jgi:4-diphosphocytidyl-2-C-methyl-D-erythritol kinase